MSFILGPEATAVPDTYTGFYIRLHELSQERSISVYTSQRQVQSDFYHQYETNNHLLIYLTNFKNRSL
jgi:hypothetical protein